MSAIANRPAAVAASSTEVSREAQPIPTSRPAPPSRAPDDAPAGSRFWFAFDRWLPVTERDDDFVLA